MSRFVLCIDNHGEDAEFGAGDAFQGVGDQDASEADSLMGASNREAAKQYRRHDGVPRQFPGDFRR